MTRCHTCLHPGPPCNGKVRMALLAVHQVLRAHAAVTQPPEHLCALIPARLPDAHQPNHHRITLEVHVHSGSSLDGKEGTPGNSDVREAAEKVEGRQPCRVLQGEVWCN